MTQRTFAVHTLGCKVNTYESDAMAGLMKRAGFSEVPFEEKADAYIINTCSVTNVADQKSRQMLHRARRRNPDAVVAAAGCYVNAAMANESMQTLLQDDAVDLFIINEDKGRIAELILERLKEKKAAEKKSAAGKSVEGSGETDNAPGEKNPDGQTPAGGQQSLTAAGKAYTPSKKTARQWTRLSVEELSGHTRAFIKIQDGCNQFCSYCIIPYVRGRIVSRPMEDVLEEVRELTEKGIREIVLTGIHLSSYGMDMETAEAAGEAKASGEAEAAGENNTAGKNNTAVNADMTGENAVSANNNGILPGAFGRGAAQLLCLIRRIEAEPGVTRIRFGSLEPRLITAEFLEGLKACRKVCPHFHLSLQSGSDTVLRRMNRHYTAEQFLEGCRLIREVYPDAAITTDIIVGFPGETEEEFEETMRFAETVSFYEAHVFKYSRRAGTKADRMPEQVPEQIKNSRSRRLIELTDRLSHEHRLRYVGRTAEFLAEEVTEKGGIQYITGYTRDYVRCLLPLKVTDGFERNRLYSGPAQRLEEDRALGEYAVLAAQDRAEAEEKIEAGTLSESKDNSKQFGKFRNSPGRTAFVSDRKM